MHGIQIEINAIGLICEHLVYTNCDFQKIEFFCDIANEKYWLILFVDVK